IAKKRDIKQAAMQQLLTGQTRLQGFSGEWHQGIFGDVVIALDAGVSVNSTDAEPALDTPCVLKTSALVGGKFLPNEAKVIEVRDVGRARTSAKGDTILVSRMNTPMLVGEIAYVAQDFDSLFLPDRVWMARFNISKKVDVRWMAFVLSSQPYRDLLRDVATGTSGSMKNISKNALRSLPIRFPSPKEQTAIATVLSDMDAELCALEARLTKTRAIKQGMMQELLTGRTRLV
ncbi:MAG: restriction endonuclease subunit S, partial [Hydrogenophaga sp.]|nr:restriction endonuclease subunit S [Hydrogenophaga sp.]